MACRWRKTNKALKAKHFASKHQEITGKARTGDTGFEFFEGPDGKVRVLGKRGRDGRQMPSRKFTTALYREFMGGRSNSDDADYKAARGLLKDSEK